MRIPRSRLSVMFATLALCSCATLSQKDPLQVAVAGIEPLQGEGLEMRSLVKLRVQNPNDAPIDYDAVYVKLDVQDKTFATGISDDAGNVRRFGESMVTVPVTVSMLRMARQIMGIVDGKPAEQIRYSMTCKLNLSAFGSMRFQTQGEFSLKPPEPAP